MLSQFFTMVRKRLGIVLIAAFLVISATELALQFQERRYLQEVTHAVIAKARAVTPEEKVMALRDYLRTHVEFHGAPVDGRPFLRATAAETLQEGKGYCGEVSRTFICMARVLDLPAQRINLYGPKPHVVAEVELPSGERLIVDCQNPPHIAELQPLDTILGKGKYDDYSTLNVRRAGIDWLISRIKLRMGPLTYWIENPHALKALFFLALAASIVFAYAARWSMRTLLRRRGWIHETNQEELKKALSQQAPPALLPTHADCAKDGGPR